MNMNIKVQPIREDKTDDAIKEYNKEKALIAKYKLDLSKRDNELNTLKAEIKKLQASNDTKDKDNQLLKQKIKEQETLISTLNQSSLNKDHQLEDNANTITQLKDELSKANNNNLNTQRSKEGILKQLFPTGTNEITISTTPHNKPNNDEAYTTDLLSSISVLSFTIDGISNNDKEIVKLLQAQVIKAKKDTESLLVQVNAKSDELTGLQVQYASTVASLEDQIKSLQRKNKSLANKNNKTIAEYSSFNKEKSELEEVIMRQEEKLTESNHNSKKLLMTINKLSKELEESRRYNSNLLDIINDLQRMNQKLKFKRAQDYQNQMQSFKTQVTQLRNNRLRYNNKTSLSPIGPQLKHKLRKRRSAMEKEREKQMISNSHGNILTTKMNNQSNDQHKTNTIENQPTPVQSMQLLPFNINMIRKRKMFISNSVSDIQEKEKVEQLKELMNILVDEVKQY